MRFKQLTKEHVQFLKSYDGVPRKDILRKFNEKYSENIPYTTMVQWLQKLGVTAPDSHFSKGHSPWNKGMDVEVYRAHFTDEQWEETIGRVLNAPHHRNKVGDIKYIKDRHDNLQPWIVVRTGKGLTTYQKIKQLDRYIWEKEYGEIPEGYILIHLNHDPLDCSIENLAIIKNGWVGQFMYWMRSENADINRTIIKWLELKDVLEKSKEDNTYGRENECNS